MMEALVVNHSQIGISLEHQTAPCLAPRPPRFNQCLRLPTGLGEGRADRLISYHQARDQIRDRMLARFGPPLATDADG